MLCATLNCFCVNSFFAKSYKLDIVPDDLFPTGLKTKLARATLSSLFTDPRDMCSDEQ